MPQTYLHVHLKRGLLHGSEWFSLAQRCSAPLTQPKFPVLSRPPTQPVHLASPPAPPPYALQDPEPGHPAIQRVSTHWANGTWKGRHHSFGAYWHSDGDFWQPPLHNVLSILYAVTVPPSGGALTH